MGNSLRCCLACVLPCGALDVIRIVHLNGYVEEITHPITAVEVLKANPNHVLSKPCAQGVVRRILILSPESELKRGSIYFLIPSSSLPTDKKSTKTTTSKPKSSNTAKTGKSYDYKTINNAKSHDVDHHDSTTSSFDFSQHLASTNVVQPQPVNNKKSSARRSDRRRRSSSGGSGSMWRPHLESIYED